jgi:hypothetical protein
LKISSRQGGQRKFFLNLYGGLKISGARRQKVLNTGFVGLVKGRRHVVELEKYSKSKRQRYTSLATPQHVEAQYLKNRRSRKVH